MHDAVFQFCDLCGCYIYRRHLLDEAKFRQLYNRIGQWCYCAVHAAESSICRSRPCAWDEYVQRVRTATARWTDTEWSIRIFSIYTPGWIFTKLSLAYPKVLRPESRLATHLRLPWEWGYCHQHSSPVRSQQPDGQSIWHSCLCDRLRKRLRVKPRLRCPGRHILVH